MRMVFPKPLTFALIRVVCLEASISYTSWAAMPLAPASPWNGWVFFWFFCTANLFYLRIVEHRDLVEYGNQVDWRDKNDENEECNGCDASPNPPGARQAPRDAE